MEDTSTHKKMLHSKRSFGMNKHLPVDSPAYDASEGKFNPTKLLFSDLLVAEDNDPLTDDAASATSIPVTRSHSSTTILSAAQSRAATQHRNRHQAPPRIAAVLSSDSGVDSPTYDGDVESSSTAIAKSIPSANSSAGTPLASPIIAPSAVSERRPPPALVLSHPASTNAVPLPVPEDSSPVVSTSKFSTASLTPEDIQLFVKTAIDGKSPRNYIINQPPVGRPVRIYADGEYTTHVYHTISLSLTKVSMIYSILGNCPFPIQPQHARSFMIFQPCSTASSSQTIFPFRVSHGRRMFRRPRPLSQSPHCNDTRRAVSMLNFVTDHAHYLDVEAASLFEIAVGSMK